MSYRYTENGFAGTNKQGKLFIYWAGKKKNCR